VSLPELLGRDPLADLALARTVVDRDAARREDPAALAAAWADPRTRVVHVGRGRVDATDPADGTAPELRLHPAGGGYEDRLRFYLGTDDDGPWFAEPVEDDEAAEHWPTPRDVGARLDARAAGLVVHAVALANWHAAHGHCPRCGTPTAAEKGGHVRRCPADGSEHFPRTDPAVIMAVVDADGRLLLGRGRGFRPKGFSTLAGFVEPGESLEAAVRREVGEESGVRVGEVRYAGSQPWPFPSSLMLGFYAEALTSATRPDGAEIAELRWFSRDALLAAVRAREVYLSPRVSIARRLIEGWYGGPVDTGPDTPLR